MDKKKILLAAGLLLLMGSTVGVGLYFKHYFVVLVFLVWLSIEFLVWRFPSAWRGGSKALTNDAIVGASALVRLYNEKSIESDRMITEKVSHQLMQPGLSLYQQKWLERLRGLVELRSLAFGKPVKGKRRVRQAFAFVQAGERREVEGSGAGTVLTAQDITDSATYVADLYWKLFDCASAKYPELTKIARRLYIEIFGKNFENESSRKKLEGVIDSMQRDRGIPFLVLNLIGMGELQWGREIARTLLTDSEQMNIDEEIRSALYWIGEIQWFMEGQTLPLGDYESSVRYLYHVCFTNPERAGFLEIDSQFFSQFETINELAREGFLFKEVLVDKLLQLWKEHEGLFDEVFQSVLEKMTGQRNKIYDNRDYWERFWSREKEDFSKEYLYVVEGNLCYAYGHYEDAVLYYEKALRLNAYLRPARLNLPFCYAKLGAVETHESYVEKLISDRSLLPSVLYVVGNSFLLLGEEQQADLCYKALEKFEGWETKGDYYKSTFCYENDLFEMALTFAKRAHKLNANDVAIRYHLSLCYNAVGEKEKALEMVKKLEKGPEWLNYYRFTLERDAGRHGEASETLLNLPSEYFEDPEELDAAVDFAKLRQDFVLLRHLKKKA